MKQRQILKVVAGTSQTDGAGVRLVRVIGHADTSLFDPFLMLDAFDSRNPADYTKGFPWHPHRGIETVTYLIEGDIEHGDSLGNKGSILDGGCQWMTAGSGIIHQEMPQAAPRMLGFQLWVNLPAKDKMCAPKYREITRDRIPLAVEDSCTVAVISGMYRTTAGAMKGDYVDATVLDIIMKKDGSCTVPTTPGNTVFLYIVEGSVSLDRDKSGSSVPPVYLPEHRAVLLSDGDELRLDAGAEGSARCILFSGKPLNEPIAWGGPIVMNTREELESAFRELDEGTFIRP
jgi:redox-sensitive bicupin YhaK (pirin superfamily)